MSRSKVFTWVLLSCSLALLAAPEARGQELVPERVWVLAQGPGETVARVGIARARLDQGITLFAAVEARLGGQPVVITEAEAVELPSGKVPAARLRKPAGLPQAARLSLEWRKVQPVGESYNNTQGGFHWDEIEYREFPWGAPDGPGAAPGAPWSRPADAHPLPPYADVQGGLGTMAFEVELAREGAAPLASPGAADRYRGGLSGRVTRVALRRDDTYLGYLTELFNTPYIWGSAGERPAEHQAERLIGADCADFIVYGGRRLGKELPYRATWHLPEVAATVARAARVDPQGRFVTERGEPVRIGAGAGEIRPGDLLLFPGHVGALREDRPPLGVLDLNDVLIHTYWAPPCEQPIRETAYTQSRVRVLRWRRGQRTRRRRMGELPGTRSITPRSSRSSWTALA
jgi:cell wall-associated NlpC family hydrolase